MKRSLVVELQYINPDQILTADWEIWELFTNNSFRRKKQQTVNIALNINLYKNYLSLYEIFGESITQIKIE